MINLMGELAFFLWPPSITFLPQVEGKGGGSRRLKLGDFGLAMVVTEPIFTVCGTPTYVAPDILSETGDLLLTLLFKCFETSPSLFGSQYISLFLLPSLQVMALRWMSGLWV